MRLIYPNITLYFSKIHAWGTMAEKDVSIIDCETVYQGYFRIQRYRLHHSLFNGGNSEVLDREVADRGDVAAVLPFDPARDAIVLIEQFRAGAMAAGTDPWLLECVAGIIEPGESAAEVAVREAREESGAVITDLVPIHTFLTTPGALTESVTLFCGRTDSSEISGVHGVASEGEDIRAAVTPADDALAMLAAGRIVNSITIIALQWLAQHREQLQRRWGD